MKEEKQKIEKEANRNQGITLVALIITIIILIILAGISINFVLGENGLFGRALQAREDYAQAEKDEQEAFNALLEEIDKLGQTAPKTVREAKEAGEYFSRQRELKDSNGNKVVVPEGFKIAGDSGDNVTEGIVIEDKDIKQGIGNDRGNQYVWIPVSNIDGNGSNPIKKSTGESIEITLGRYEFADGTNIYNDEKGSPLNGGSPLVAGTEILRQSAQNYTTPKAITTRYQELPAYQAGNASSGLDGQNRTALNLADFIDSVRKNGGYYIARYEASYGEDEMPNSKVSNNPNDSISAPTQEGSLWNNIIQIDAAQKCENMYTTISSDLINSYAWDTAIVYIQKFSNKTTYSRQEGKSINSSLTNTGTKQDEVCKIHDMASNCTEWTTENSTSKDDSKAYPCVLRGSNYYDINYYTSSRGSYSSATYSYKNYTFRSILYIKK